MVNIFYEETEILDLDPEFFVSWFHRTCAVHEVVLGEINLIFCSDDFLLDINREHLKHDYYTDIITFNYNENNVSGDLFISVDRIKENSSHYKVDFINELHRVVIHGVLHLIGFNDKTPDEEAEMREEEEKGLRLIVSRET